MTNEPTCTTPNKILQHFGSLVTSVNLNLMEGWRYFDKEIVDRILQNCRETLVKVSISNIQNLTMYGHQEPFTSVETLILRNGELGTHFGPLNKRFPKLKTLKLEDLKTLDPECIEESFPLLRRVKIHNPEKIQFDDNEAIFTNENLRVFFRLNPQIEELILKHDVDDGIKLNERFLSSMQRSLPNLTSLLVDQSNIWNTKPGRKVHFPNLQHFTIAFHHCVLQNLPIECATLNVLRVICQTNNSVDYKAISDVVKRFSSIKSLTIWSCNGIDLNNSFIIALPTVIPNLQKLFTILYPEHSDSIDLNFINFMLKCKLLRTITIAYMNTNEVDLPQFERKFRNNTTVNQLDGRWNIKYRYSDMTHIIIEKED